MKFHGNLFGLAFAFALCAPSVRTEHTLLVFHAHIGWHDGRRKRRLGLDLRRHYAPRDPFSPGPRWYFDWVL